MPVNNAISYNNLGNQLEWVDGSICNAQGYFFAPVQLPDGATITSITLHFESGVEDTVYPSIPPCDDPAMQIRLMRSNFANSNDEIAVLNQGNEPSGYIHRTTSSISYGLVDNDLYTYFIELSMWSNGSFLSFWGAEIEYTISAPY